MVALILCNKDTWWVPAFVPGGSVSERQDDGAAALQGGSKWATVSEAWLVFVNWDAISPPSHN